MKCSSLFLALLGLLLFTNFKGVSQESSQPQISNPNKIEESRIDKRFEEALKNEIQKEEIQGNDSFWKNFFYMLFVLSFIVSLIFALAWFMKRMVHTRLLQENALSNIKIIDKRSLSPKTMLYIIEAEGKRMVVGESTNGITRLIEKNLASDFSISDQETQESFQKIQNPTKD